MTFLKSAYMFKRDNVFYRAKSQPLKQRRKFLSDLHGASRLALSEVPERVDRTQSVVREAGYTAKWIWKSIIRERIQIASDKPTSGE